MYAVNFTEQLAAGVKTADPNWKTIPCNNGWEFDLDEIPYATIATEVRARINETENKMNH